MKYFFPLILLLTSCSMQNNTPSGIIPEPNKPQLSKINWNEINFNGEMLYTLDQKNMDILNNNLIEIYNYERKQQSQIQYYQNLLK